MSQILFDQVGTDTKTISNLNVTKSLKSPGGIPVLPAPVGNIYYVNSVTGSDSNSGTTTALPFATLNKSLTQTKSNNGDIVYCMPGHVETVASAAALTFPVTTAHGVTVVFLGNEVERAQINYTTSTAATVTIPANNVTLIGGRVRNSIDARVDGFVITGNDCTFKDMEWVDDTGTSSLVSVRTTAAANRLRMTKIRCYFSENTGSARTEFIRIVGGNDHEINDFDNDPGATFSTSIINNVTTATIGLDLTGVLATNAATAPAITYVSTSTGTISRSIFQSAGISAATFPSQGSAFAIDADTVINAGSHMVNTVQGSPVAFQKSFVSSSLTTAPVTFVTCTGGTIIVEGITVETDATGLAGGTNHQLLTNNALGVTGVIAAETVANLGANKTVDLTAASITALRKGFVLESGKVLQLDNTLAAGTGTGKIYYNIWGRILSGAPILS